MIIQKTEKVYLSASERAHLDLVMRMMTNGYDHATFPELKECFKTCSKSLSDFLDFTDYYDDYACDSDDPEEEEEVRDGEDLYW